MATRAPRKVSRPRDGYEEAAQEALGFGDKRPARARSGSSSARTRTTAGKGGTTGKGGTSSKSGTSSKGGTAKRPAARRGSAPPRGRRTPPPPKASSDPFVILLGWLARAIAGAWMIVAGGVGYAARAIGKSARDLDPHHRRDGLGLLTLGGAIVLAAALWARMGNPVGRGLHYLLTGALGSLAWVLPLLVALLA